MNSFAHRGGRERTPTATVNLVMKTAEHIGLDLHPILVNTGLGYLATGGFDPRLSPPLLTQFIPVYRALIDACGAGRRLPTKEDVELFCGCLINCVSLQAALDRAARFNTIANQRWGTIHLSGHGKEAVWELDSYRSDGAATDLTLDIFCLSFFHRLFSWLTAVPLPMLRVELRYPELLDRPVIEGLFGCPIHFGVERNALVFHADALSNPLVRTYADLVAALAVAPVALLPLPPAVAFSSQVEMILRRAAEHGASVPNFDEVAALLGQSVSTLRRRLLRENTSFQAIVDRWRTRRATELLGDTDMTFDDIAMSLGFSGASVFSRAFKSWTGHAPSAYRRLLIAHGAMPIEAA